MRLPGCVKVKGGQAVPPQGRHGLGIFIETVIWELSSSRQKWSYHFHANLKAWREFLAGWWAGLAQRQDARLICRRTSVRIRSRWWAGLVWRQGAGQISRRTWVRIRFASDLLSLQEVVVRGNCFWLWPPRSMIREYDSPQSAESFWWWQCSGRKVSTLSPTSWDLGPLSGDNSALDKVQRQASKSY